MTSRKNSYYLVLYTRKIISDNFLLYRGRRTSEACTRIFKKKYSFFYEIYGKSSFGFNVYIEAVIYVHMVCHICLDKDATQKIDRLDLCERCFKEVEKRLGEIGNTKT